MGSRRVTSSAKQAPRVTPAKRKSALPDQREGAEPGPDGAALCGDENAAIPRLPRVFVPRARLWSRLEESTDIGLTLVVAPVGAGKTLGVAGWLRATGRSAGTRWVDADSTWVPERLAEVLTESGLLVVDDAHRLPAASLRLLDDRLNNAPEAMRLVLMSRWDLPLSRLVPELMGHLSIVRGDLLRMGEVESAPLIAEHARTEHPDVIAAVTHRAEGWAAAVVLASRAIATEPDPAAAARRYAEGRASVADSLANEVFAALHASERHLLLCVASEETVTVEDAAHLSRDQRAGEILAGLEATGLLVNRLPPEISPRPSTSARDDGSSRARPHLGETRYRIHPLLTEVVRRRFVAGGVDVAQAQATIRRAVRLDVARGETDHAFARLVVTNQPTEAARLLAEDGADILLRGREAPIAAFARTHLDTLDAMPGTWFAMGLDRWLDNDASGASHWLDRLVAEWDETDAGDIETNESLCPRVACTRLLRALLGHEPLAVAVGHARRVVLAQMRTSTQDTLLPLLLAELGVGQAWLGDLSEAEVNLTSAAALGRAKGLHRLAAGALSHLALVAYMQGRESACIEIAQEAIDAAEAGGQAPDFIRARALLARDLGRMCDLPWPQDGMEPGVHPTPLHVGDPVSQFWASLREARLALVAGSVPTALQVLETPMTWLALPEHLRVVVLLERGYLASLAGDLHALKEHVAELKLLGARGEAELLTGLRQELEGDRKAAAASYAVAEEDVTHAQPASRALALACEAQLLDVLGRSEEAMMRLREAATITEVRRNAVPFLGWSRQGTPIETLLRRLDSDTTNAWVHELAEAAAGKPDIATIFAPMTATPRERGHATDPTVRPSLSAREREVLNELARGATYADIAADLFVSENTVKTHVSSLYSKLAVTRRSEALAVARNLHLL